MTKFVKGVINKAVLLTLIISPFILQSFKPPHANHSSMILIKSDLKTKTISITANIFSDDLEMAIETVNKKQIELDDPQLKEYLQNYLSQKFSIKINNQIVPITILDFTPVENIISIKLMAVKTSSIKNATITNQILLELFNDQNNIVKIEENGKTRELFYDKSKQTQKVSFDKSK